MDWRNARGDRIRRSSQDNGLPILIVLMGWIVFAVLWDGPVDVFDAAYVSTALSH
jgi:hypothetical protein